MQCVWSPRFVGWLQLCVTSSIRHPSTRCLCTSHRSWAPCLSQNSLGGIAVTDDLPQAAANRVCPSGSMCIPTWQPLCSSGDLADGAAPKLGELGSWRRQRKDGGREFALAASLPQVSPITTTHEFNRARRDMVGHIATWPQCST